VRVRCDPSTPELREQARGDRFLGTAGRQAAELEGVPFDYDVVTDHEAADDLAAQLLAWLESEPAPIALAELGRRSE
jgi:hypothetical protein